MAIKINGSGIIEGTTSLATNADVAAGLALKADWGASTYAGCTFRAVRAMTDQAISGGSITVIFDLVDFDRTGITSSSTYSTLNGRWTPTVAGYYLVSAQVRPSATSGTFTLLQGAIFRNNVATYRLGELSVTTGTVGFLTLAGEHIVYMNGTTDFLHVGLSWSMAAGGAVIAVVGGGAVPFLHHFQASFLRPHVI